MNVSFKMADLYKGVDPYRVYDELAVLGNQGGNRKKRK